MASDKATDFVKTNNPGRVNISYEDPYDSEKMVELPFVMGIMSDLSGNASEKEKAPVGERDFREVSAKKLDEFMADVEPGLSFRVDNKLTDEGGKLGVNLKFSSMDDFGPAQVAEQVPSLKKLLDARKHLANLQRYMNGKPEAQAKIKELLNDPDLMSALAERAAADKAEDSDEQEND